MATERIDVSTLHMAAWAQCVCGEVFNAAGDPASVKAKERQWNERHAQCATTPREGTKTFWLSFCDSDRPTGSQFLGACVVDVTATEADEAALEVALRFPLAQPNAEWLAAAIKNAHRFGCNPGGEVASAEIPAGSPMLAYYQRGVLMDRATIKAIDDRIEAASAHPAVDPVAGGTTE